MSANASLNAAAYLSVPVLITRYQVQVAGMIDVLLIGGAVRAGQAQPAQAERDGVV
jgi:hypothetical protein